MKLNANPICRMLDKLFEYIIKSRAGWRCELCNSNRDGLDCHHVFTRGNHWIRWDPDNGVATCQAGCHDRKKVLDWLLDQHPERYWRLLRKKNTLHHGQKIDLQQIRLNLELQL